jgi:hypothetical protein
MKKGILLLSMFCVSFFALSQDVKRENIDGKIIIEGSDIGGVAIYNSSSKIGTITNQDGEFEIAVALNDLIEVRALQYQNFDIVINKTILESKKLRLFLIEEINKLDEVLITNKKLTGNIATDIKSVKFFKPKLNAIYFGINKEEAQSINNENISNIENTALPLTMVNGLNIVNVVDQLLIPLFRSEVKDKKAAGIPVVPVKSIKYYLGSAFLMDNFNIPDYRVEEFIRYVEDDTFDFDLLNYGHEIEFLELLSKKSKMFLKTKTNVE